ncbi:MAG: HAD family phosphatase [Kiritimatiellota bacterium]|nr:HAD family phosphatase [Kiritimatiellota bacterium]
MVLHTVRGTFNSLLAERLDVHIEDVERVMNSPVNDLWDMGEISDDEFYSHLLSGLNFPMEKKEVMAKFVIDDFYVDQEMLTYIRELKKSCTTALLTNFPAHLHDFMRTAWPMDGAFDHIITSADVKLIKPDPRIYQLTLDRIGCQAHEAVFIDDRENNVEAAAAMGIKGIHFISKAKAIADLSRVIKSSR